MTVPTLNEGDIITVKCRVECGTERWSQLGGSDDLCRVTPIDRYHSHNSFGLNEKNFDRFVRHHFEVGQTVRKQTSGPTAFLDGVVESITKSGNWLVVNVPGRADEPDIWAADKCEPVVIEDAEDPDFAEVEEAPSAPEPWDVAS